MKKIFLVLVIVFAFGMNANAQEIAMVDNSVVNTYLTDDSSKDELKELKNMLVEELKVYSLWKYEDSHYNKIKITKVTSDKDTYVFIWTYQAPSKKKVGYDYIRKYKFTKYRDNPIGDSRPASKLGIRYVKR